MTGTQCSSRLLALGILTSILFAPSSILAAPKKIPVKNISDIYQTTDELGKTVHCVTFNGKTLAGTLVKNGTLFKPTNSKVKGKLRKLKLQKNRASGQQAKKLQKKIKRFKKLKKRHSQACGVGKPEQLLKTLSRAVTDEDIRYLTEKAGFGFGQLESSLSAIKGQGIEAVVTEFMRVKSEPSGFQATYNNWLDGSLSANTDTSSEGIRRAWIYAMHKGNNPFRERLALWMLGLWTAADDVLESNEAYLLSDYINGNNSVPLKGIRGYAYNPNMRDMAINMSKSAMMLIYLDGASNIKDNPNENFARELFELFTTGTEDLEGNPNYTEEGDIVKAASALTGWRVASGERGFSPFDQDPGTFVLFEGTSYACTVSGTGQGKIDQVVNCIFNNHPNVAIYYAQELLKEFLTPTPSNELVRALAEVIKENNFHLDEAIKTLLSSETFYSEAFKNTVPKNSTEYAVETVRILGLPIETDDLELWIRKMGMSLTSAPTVFWFPEATWTSAPIKLEALNFSSEVIEDDYSSEGWEPADALPSGSATSGQVVDYVANRLGVTLTRDQKTQIEFFLDNQRNSDGSFTNDPYDNESNTHQRERGLGVYQILTMAIDYQMK